MATQKQSSGRSAWAGWLRWPSWLLGLILAVSLGLWLGVGDILGALVTLRSDSLLLALGAFALGHLVRILKWRLPLGDQYGWLALTRLFLMSKIGGALLPGRVGEIAPVAQPQFRSTRVVAWLAADRVMEAYATLVFGAWGLTALGLGEQRILALWGSTFVFLLVLLILLLYQPLWSWLEHRTRRWSPISRLFELACRISGDVLQFRRCLWPALGLTLLGTYLDLWLVKSLFLSTGIEVAMDIIAASYCLSALIAFVSITPGGLGIVELTSLYIYNRYGVPEVQTGVVMLLSRGLPLLQAGALMLFGMLNRGITQDQGPSGTLKVCLVASDGGHLTDLLRVGQETCQEHQVFYLTHRSPATQGLPQAYLVAKIGTSVWRMAVASLITLHILWRERPDVVISTGAEIALPAFYLGKFLFGARLVYIECSGVAAHPTRTGRLVYPIADLFLVQWETLLKHYGPRARYAGGLI